MITIKYTDKTGNKAITKIDCKVNECDLKLLNKAFEFAALDPSNFDQRVADYLKEYSQNGMVKSK